ncbi:MAG TPA: glycosyltransferase family 39 protein [Candidatus Tumulicola sp.]|nr:glycosyltransferase family 39 protein [Candidatus Tumulicola sp.]
MGNKLEHPALAACVGAAVAAIATLPGLGSGTLWDNSETAYGEVAREILITHDWAVMHFNTVPYFVQPPLYFWLAAAFSLLFGLSSFALRLPSALATIALAAATGYAVARQAGTRVGIYASLILSSCLMVAVIGRLAIMDALLDLAVALAIFWWFRGLETGRDRYVVYGWIAVALGFLAKGPVAPVAALMVAIPFYFWNARCEKTYPPSARAWLLGLSAFAVIVVPWPLILVSRFRLFPLQELFGYYTFGRYTGIIENQSGPLWYYLPVLLLGFFPWIAFFPMAVAYGIRLLRGATSDPGLARLVRLSVCWIVVPLLFFSFARTKLPNYVALEFPALALVVAIYFEAVVRRGGTRSAVVSASFVPIGIGMLAIAIAIFLERNRLDVTAAHLLPGVIAMGAAIFAGSLLTALLLTRRPTAGAAPYALVCAALIAIDVLAVAILPLTDAYKPIPRLAAIVDRDRRPFDVVAIQSISGGNALLFYTRPDVAVLAPARDGGREDHGIDPRVAICGARRAWVIAPKRRPSYDPTYGRRRTLVATDLNAALFLYDGPPCS